MRDAVALQSERPPGNVRPMADDERPIGTGDRVVHLGAPGIFVVMSRRGPLLDIESDRGLRTTVHEVAVRRLTGPPPAPADPEQ